MTEEVRQRKTTTTNHGDLTPECRICFDSEETELNRLFRPCLCRGTQAYVHEECLNQWRTAAHDHSAFYQCTTCKYQYRINRIWYAHFFTNRATLVVLTLFFISVSIGFVAYFIKTLAFLVLGVKMTKNFWALSSKLVLYAIALIGFVTFILTIFGEDADFNFADFHLDPFFFDSTFFTGLSYSISAFGFVIFIKKVYNGIEFEMKKQMMKIHERILEGHVQD